MYKLTLVSLFLVCLYSNAAMAFTLTSPAFDDASKIPDTYTCDGRDTPPDLYWADPPAKTKSFALILDDPDAPREIWIHWVIFNMPATVRQWTAQTPVAAGVIEGNNSWRNIGYRGPCPPGGTHRYVFTLYALDALLDLPTGANPAQVRAAAESHILGRAILMGKYSKRY